MSSHKVDAISPKLVYTTIRNLKSTNTTGIDEITINILKVST